VFLAIEFVGTNYAISDAGPGLVFEPDRGAEEYPFSERSPSAAAADSAATTSRRRNQIDFCSSSKTRFPSGVM
jgi:hypothetical protein